MDQTTVKLSIVPKKVPSVNELGDFRFGWNARDRIFYGLADNGNGTREVVPIGGAVQGTPTGYGTFKGTCDLHTDPGTPVADEWWSATEVGIYANFGNVKVTTMDEVFNYIYWNNATSTWSIEVVPVNMSLMQIPKVVDGVWDLNVNKNLEIEVKPYAFRKLADPGYPYFYAGAEANPAYHNRLNMDGDLYLSKLFAWAINMPAGTALKWLTLDANKNIAFSDAPSGGVTPNDNILDWNTSAVAYKPYAAKKSSDPGFPYFYTDTDPFRVPSFWNTLNIDGVLIASQLKAIDPYYGDAYFIDLYGFNGASGSGYYFKLVFDPSDGAAHLFGVAPGDESSKIRIGSSIQGGNYNGEHILIDDANQRFDINMTKVRFNKGTANKFLRLDANKESQYVDVPVSLARFYTEVTNVGANPTDAYTYALPANTLDADGKQLEIMSFGISVLNSNAKEVYLWFGSNPVNGITLNATHSTWKLKTTIVRVSANQIKTLMEYWIGTNGAGGAGVSVQVFSSINFSIANTLKLTLDGVANSDITAIFETIKLNQ